MTDQVPHRRGPTSSPTLTDRNGAGQQYSSASPGLSPHLEGGVAPAAHLPGASYSRIPPIRLAQKISKGITIAFDYLAVLPAEKAINKLEYLAWRIKGKPLFDKRLTRIAKSADIRKLNPRISNIKKGFYAPLSISTKYFPFHKKVWHTLRHKRPNWYKRYHEYPIVHYFHFAVLIIFTSIVGFGLYNTLFGSPAKNQPVLAAGVTAPLRILSFQGRLTDASDNPITSQQQVRFIVYSDPTASGSARLWEEVDTISPDSDGIFSILLGSNGSGGNAALCNGGNPPSSPAAGACGIPQSLFAQNQALYLEVTIGNGAPLTPRQQIATVAYATNAEVLQGLPPITDSSVTTNTNTVLALNSSGVLSIPGTSATTFQQANGQLTLQGKVLALTTASGTNTNVQIAPDGLGTIDLQKPIQNSTNNNNIASAVGSVEVDDLFSILATSSGQSAFTINQNGAGPLISASSSGTAKFTVDNSGNGYFAGNVGIGTTSPSSPLQAVGNISASSSNTYALLTPSLFGINHGYIADSGLYLSNQWGNKAAVGVDNNNGYLDFWAANSTTPTMTMTSTNVGIGYNNPGSALDVNGNVGIGTTAPAAGLDVSSAGGVALNDNKLFLANGGNPTHWIDFNGTDTWNYNEGIQFQAYGQSNAVTMFLSQHGNVGIGNGTTNPTSKLQVAGDITPEATGTRNLGSSSLYWNTLYVNNVIGPTTGTQGFWQRNLGALSPTNITDDLLLGGI
ncbi:MAG: hypothetical protein M1289_02190, partial [Patescibacteria group bacterium]|nr:hypothetical protein [Patescibacteria group bacterium]